MPKLVCSFSIFLYEYWQGIYKSFDFLVYIMYLGCRACNGTPDASLWLPFPPHFPLFEFYVDDFSIHAMVANKGTVLNGDASINTWPHTVTTVECECQVKQLAVSKGHLP